MHQHHAPHQHHTPTTEGNVIRWASHYDQLVTLLTLGQRAKLRHATVDLAHLQPGATVLEVGCGTGDVALIAKERVGPSGRVYGIDPASEMIAVAREKATQAGVVLDFQVGVIESLAFSAATFDVVLSSLMMHHLPSNLKRRGLAEIARVLKPGGRLLIVDFKRPTTHVGRVLLNFSLHGALSEGVQDLANYLGEAGFTQVQTGNVGMPALGFVSGYVG